MRSLAILLLLASCAGEPSPSLAAARIAEELDSPSAHWARATIVYPPQLADVAGGLPLLMPPKTRPIVGRQFIASWTTRPTAPYEDVQTALIIGKRIEPVELEGANGGMLMVSPDRVFTPDLSKGFFNGFLTQEDGEVAVNVTFQPGQQGTSFYAQLLVMDPRTPLRVTFSPMLWLTVGDR